ncbi:hypothetical protein halTADL_2605 [Halohasta litchfieldiae]|jgi:hypothetical protein|uniref:Uncharacterized protein n=1 Tax=Halohasta litchfieldiae TaxID=1073996 RepID=A0A1H6RUU9_9EURY|nr:hypothetical protein [Halohasta litchfieldiae]ATW89334.1 hypothetical protein halTADL_2605 [Halohasta litchfieldiae]SEI59648.1 hypothetical protein SAMN05444271_103126 [Halohasta litchfieldiae]
MSTALRNGLRIALNEPRVFGLAGSSILLDILTRLVLAGTVHPVLAVLWPPVVALPLLGAGAPTVRRLADDPASTPQWALGSTLREIGPRLIVGAVVGHLCAIVLGTSAFLIVDTAVRILMYAIGWSVPAGLVFFLPLPGVAAGTLLAWGLLVPTVAQLATGRSLRDAADGSLRALADRRRTAYALSLHGGIVFIVAATVGICLLLANEQYATQEAAFVAFVTLIGVGVAVLLVLGVFAYPIHVAFAATATDRPRTIPVGRIAIACLLVSGLVIGASAIRVTESRPMPATTASTPLPADGTAAYATAIGRTAAVDHRLIVDQARDDERIIYSAVVERSSRQILVSQQSRDRSFTGYADSGVVYRLHADSFGLFSLGERRINDDSVRSLPGYWELNSGYDITDAVGFDLPDPQTGNWETIHEENGILTLELTDDQAVFDAVLPVDSETMSAETAWIRMRVDRERGVVLGGRAVINGTYNEYNDNRVSRAYNYTVKTGRSVDVHRPDVLGSRSVGEWTWDLFAY